MLRRTFLHLYGVGEATERRWWRAGWTDWSQYLAAKETPDSPSAREENRRRIEACVTAWDRGAWRALNALIPQPVHWRAFGERGLAPLYLDIETEGDAANTVTVIGLYDGVEYRAFVAERNLDEAMRLIDRHALIVTYNGARFDWPVLEAHFREPINAFHIDLVYPARRLGLRGGLKAIETMLGLQRPDAIRGLTGWDAVRLWAEYRRGSREALDVLIAYNQADTVHLKALMEHVWTAMTSRLEADLRGF